MRRVSARGKGVHPLTTTYDAGAALAQMLRSRIGEPRFNLWFADKTRFTCHDHQLIVGVPNLFLQDWLQKTFAEDVRAVAQDFLGESATIRFVIDPQLFQASRQREAEEPSPGSAPQANAVPPPR